MDPTYLKAEKEGEKGKGVVRYTNATQGLLFNFNFIYHLFVIFLTWEIVVYWLPSPNNARDRESNKPTRVLTVDPKEQFSQFPSLALSDVPGSTASAVSEEIYTVKMCSFWHRTIEKLPFDGSDVSVIYSPRFYRLFILGEVDKYP